jgi:periplasmic protein TonB
VTVAAPSDAQVAFAVPVQGAVVVAKEARLASPPPPVTHAPPARPTQFDPRNAAGTFPEPTYPPLAQTHQYQGTATIEIFVDADGKITSAKVQKSSGYAILDEAALKVVKERWRFKGTGTPQGPLIWPCTFQLQ